MDNGIPNSAGAAFLLALLVGGPAGLFFWYRAFQIVLENRGVFWQSSQVLPFLQYLALAFLCWLPGMLLGRFLGL